MTKKRKESKRAPRVPDGKKKAVTILESGEKYTLEDFETKSHGIFPIKVDDGYQIEVAKLDGELIEHRRERERCSDALLYTIPEKEGEKITCLVELKGTEKEEKVDYAVDQLLKTIGYLQDLQEYPKLKKYLEDRSYVMAAIAGAPDKTLPRSANSKITPLCRKLYSLSKNRKSVRKMEDLVFYVAPDKVCRKFSIAGQSSPYSIRCHNAANAFIPVPETLNEILKGNMK